MGQFEKALDKHIEFLESEERRIRMEKSSLDWGHECDCEYCIEQEEVPEKTLIRAEQLKDELKSIEQLKDIVYWHCTKKRGKDGKTSA